MYPYVLSGLVLAILALGGGFGGDASVPPASAAAKPARTVAQRHGAYDEASVDRTIHLNFKDADIHKIIDLISALTGKNFLVDEKLQGKITVVAPQPVSLAEAYQVFLSILETRGFTVVPQGPISKIVPVKAVQQRPLPTAVAEQAAPAATGDAYVTQLIPLAFADANAVRTLLAPLVAKESSLLAYPPTNTLILTDVTANVTRLLTIIRTLDIETASVLYKVIRLQHAAAAALATMLQSALESLAHAGKITGVQVADVPPSARTPKVPTKILADRRTNSLVVIATPGDMAVAEDLISALDVSTPTEQGQIHVYHLAHIDADDLVEVLTAQAMDIARLAAERAAPGSDAPRGGRNTPAGARAQTRTGTTSTGITITAHRPTNALVITAPPNAYALMKEIITQLDIRRSQVLVESLIAEVSIDQTEAFGVEWRLINEPNGTQVFGSSLGTGDAGVLNTLIANPLSAPPGLLLGVLRNSITIGGQEVFNIPAILRASQSNTNIDILATPNLLAIDNEEAQIVIGEERPFLQATTDTPSGGVIRTTRAFEFRDTGITLRVTPKIGANGTVRLQLFLELTSFVSEAETGAVTTTKRAVQTSVIIDDGQTIIVGGLIRDDQSTTQTLVPCLGMLPIFGWLFKQTSALQRKTNLLIFLTPHILATPDDVRRLTTHKRQQSEKANEIKEQLQPPFQDNLELLLN